VGKIRGKGGPDVASGPKRGDMVKMKRGVSHCMEGRNNGGLELGRGWQMWRAKKRGMGASPKTERGEIYSRKRFWGFM